MKSVCRSLLFMLASVAQALALLLAALALMSAGLLDRWTVATLCPAEQARIDAQVAQIAEQWSVSPTLLASWTQNAAEAYHDTLRAWVNALLCEEGADTVVPLFFGERENAFVREIMADATFRAAVPEELRRAVARDEVAYAVDNVVRSAVFPLRISVVEAALRWISPRFPLHQTRALIVGAIVGLLLAHWLLACLIRCGRGAALAAAALVLAALLFLRWLNLPGMLAELNALSALRCQRWINGYSLLAVGMAAVSILLPWPRPCRARS